MSVSYSRSFVAVDGYGLPQIMFLFDPNSYTWQRFNHTLTYDHWNGMAMMIPDEYWPCDDEGSK